MKTYQGVIAGELVLVHEFDSWDDDPTPLFDMIRRNPLIGFDTESSGTDVYEKGWFTRLAQFGTDKEAYVLRYDMHQELIKRCIDMAEALIIHNADHDIGVLHAAYGFPLEYLYPKTIDTLTLSRLIDPMGFTQPKGGDGKIVPTHALKERIRQLVDGTFEADKALTARFRELKLSASKGGYGKIAIDDPVYVLYAGYDPMLAYRMLRALGADATKRAMALFEYERRVAYVLSTVHHKGLAVDFEYSRQESMDFLKQAEVMNNRAYQLGFPAEGIAKKDDKELVVEWLKLNEIKVSLTDKGGYSLSKPNMLANIQGREDDASRAIREFFTAKELVKFDADYIQKFIAAEETDGRLHPVIDPMGAQTGRNSISKPPLQQIPSHGTTRGCLVADEGFSLVGCDKSQIEVRVAAVLSQDQNMLRLLMEGADMPNYIAEVMYGPDFTEDQRTVGKRGLYGKFYGAGAPTVSRQTGVSEEVARTTLQTLDKLFPGLKPYARRLGQQPYVETFVGRRVAVDPQRSYGAINYDVQSTARDLFMFDLLRLVDAGLLEFLWLLVHDEIILNVPKSDAEDVAHIMKTLMTGEWRGVPMLAKAQVMGKRWTK